MKQNQKTGICIFIIVLAVLLLWTVVLNQRSAAQNEIPAETEKTTEEEPVVVTNVSEAQNFAYLAREQDETLVVYLGDGETVYMETGIKTARLSDSLRQQLQRGIGFSDAESLFEFLENYAS